MPLSPKPDVSANDEVLMANIAEGDTSSFDILYGRYSKRLLSYFYRMLGGCEQKAQDFLQDIFIKVVEKPKRFDGANFSTWIFTIAHNMCKNEYRRLHVRREAAELGYVADIFTPPAPISDQIDRLLDDEAFSVALCDALQEIPQAQRQIFLLRYQQHFSLKEISEIANCSEGTVKSRLYYTIRKLARKLDVYNPRALER